MVSADLTSASSATTHSRGRKKCQIPAYIAVVLLPSSLPSFETLKEHTTVVSGYSRSEKNAIKYINWTTTRLPSSATGREVLPFVACLSVLRSFTSYVYLRFAGNRLSAMLTVRVDIAFVPHLACPFKVGVPLQEYISL